MAKVELKNIKAVKRLSFELPEDGGVIEFRGGQGTGKSTALDAIAKTLGAERKTVGLTDGETKGHCKVGSTKLSVTANRQTRIGNLEFSVIESRFDLTDLVNPGFEKKEANDAARKRALINLFGIEASLQYFRPLFKSEDLFKRVALDVDPTSDPIVLARRFKSSLEKHAREDERQSSELNGAISATSQMAPRAERPDLNLDDAQKDYERTTKDLVKIEAEKESFDRVMKVSEERLKKLEDAMRSIDGETSTPRSIAAQIRSHEKNQTEISEQIRNLENDFENEGRIISELKGLYEKSVNRIRLESEIEVERQNLRESGPKDEEIQEAKKANLEALDKLELVKDWCRFSEHEARSKVAVKKKKEHDRRAAFFRKKAKLVESTLFSQIPDSLIQFDEDGEMIVKTDRSDHELFDDLSEGERYKIGIDLIVERLGSESRQALIVIRQEGWDALQPANKLEVSRHAKERGVIVLAGTVTDDPEIKAERYEKSS